MCWAVCERVLGARAPNAESATSGCCAIMPMAVRDLVEEWFESDALRAVIAARGVLLSGLAPRMPGSAAVLLADGAGNDGGPGRSDGVRPRRTGRAVRSAGVGGALARGRDADRRCVSRASDGRAMRSLGVALADGEEIDAPVVVSTLDPKTTLLSLIEPEVLGPRLSWRASNIRQRGMTAKVNFALSDAAALPGRRGRPAQAARADRARAVDEVRSTRRRAPAKYGEMSAEPLIEATIPTLVDPSLVDDGRAGGVKHVLSAIVQWVPAGDGRCCGEVAMRTLEAYAPGFADLVE